MVRQIVFTLVFLLIGCGSFIFGLMSCRSVEIPQFEEIQDTQTQSQTQVVQGVQVIPISHGGQAVHEDHEDFEDMEEIVVRPRMFFASILIPDLEAERGLQKSYADKSQQVLTVWETLKTANGVVNILMSAGAVGSESLAPIDNIMNRLSKMLSFACSVIIFWKVLLMLSSYMIFLAVIPICALITIIIIWTYKDRKKVLRIIIVSVLISIVVPFAVPASFMLSTLMDNHILSRNVETLLVSIDEKRETADTMERNVLAARRQGSSVVNYIGNARTLGNELIEDVINYYIIFIFVYLVIPVLLLLTLILLTRYVVNLILKR